MSTETLKNAGGPTVFGVIGWIGTLLVFAVGRHQVPASPSGLSTGTTRRGPVWLWCWSTCAGQWRDIGEFYKGRGARYGTLAMRQRAGVRSASSSPSTTSASRQNKRWDLTSNQVYSLSDQTIKMLQNLDAPVKITVFDQRAAARRATAIGCEVYTYHSPRSRPSTSIPRRTRSRAKAAQDPALGDDRARVQGPHRAGDHAVDEQDARPTR